MRLLAYTTFLCLLLSLTEPVTGATLIESRESDTGIQKTWVDGNRLRVETEDQNQYMLLHFADRTVYLVNHDRQTVVDMSGLALADQPHSVPAPAGYRIINRGSGPEIAGFASVRHDVVIGEKTCLEAYTSIKAMSDLDLLGFIRGMNEMFPQAVPETAKDDPCLHAETALKYEEIGIPLRLVKNGSESYRVISLTAEAALPEGGFVPPSGYRQINFSQMVKETMEDSAH